MRPDKRQNTRGGRPLISINVANWWGPDPTRLIGRRNNLDQNWNQIPRYRGGVVRNMASGRPYGGGGQETWRKWGTPVQVFHPGSTAAVYEHRGGSTSSFASIFPLELSLLFTRGWLTYKKEPGQNGGQYLTRETSEIGWRWGIVYRRRWLENYYGVPPLEEWKWLDKKMAPYPSPDE